MSASLPPGWTAHQAPDGRWYYTHTSTGVTQWTPPPLESPLSGISTVPTYSGITYTQLTEFKLKEKYFSLSGDSFDIMNITTGEVVFKIKGNALSFKDSKKLHDSEGNALLKMSESLVSVHGRMHIEDAVSKRTLLTLRKKSMLPLKGAKTVQAWRGKKDDGDSDLECHGDLLRKDFTIKETPTGRLLATVKRNCLTVSNILLDKDSYVIRIEPQVDAALIVFLVIAIDEQYHD